MVNIMILGLRGSGKDTVANHLELRHTYMKFALADRIRRTAEILGLSPTKTNLIKIGEKVKEICGQTKWIDLLDKDIELWIKDHNNYTTTYQLDEKPLHVITDVRRTYEYSHYLEKGYIPVKIVASFDKCVSRVVERDGNIDMDAFGHSTETEQANLQGIIINNNGSLEELYAKVDKLMQMLEKESYREQCMHLFRKELKG
ncbi:adenylate kinase-like protein [Bacillus phage v_B-Bak6]|uniref:Adenylate kinase-like protein n=2 Tax=Basiliskvirus TaxID=3044670 RepID=A0A385IK00_9CAUD|nr:deoxynucleoside monophosphate kinase [Bacillus phage Basilisk]YP_010656972.1 deoxynucleoside monophosphate kinase [Bacillus phage v_B-Bak10]AXY83027.1 adenylate kinase-like protein [Bacillus phage v_B-Bak1]AXY83147.1 adenylate kinase-like protein [Bacillus phage v_B-Bak6]AGR46620.1 adenylate kinase-like protein [Bacillus phage Basilisk]AXY83234.1 adenylate kinase-like protein [Bacillus phage v_B-Bak10]